MHCPNCHALDTRVIETRVLQLGLTVRRRRHCDSCEKRFTTYENINIQLPMIVKADGRRENFNRDKVTKGLKKACQKRPVTTHQLDQLVAEIEKALSELSLKEVRAETLGNLVMEKLYQLDPVAYVRFGSFYWNFEDVDSFVKGLQTNLDKDNEQPLQQ